NTVRFTARVRTKLVNAPRSANVPLTGAWVQCEFEDNQHKNLGLTPMSFNLDGNHDWTSLQTIGDVPAGATYVLAALVLQTALGTADFSQVNLEANPPLGGPGGEQGVPALDQNEFPQGDFETLDAHGIVPGWGGGISAQIMKFMSEDGNHFLRLINLAPHGVLATEKYFSLEPAWRTLLLSVRIRASHPTGGNPDARLDFLFRNALGEWQLVAHPQLLPTVYRSGSWITLRTLVAVPRGAVQIKLTPAVLGLGTVDFDDIRIIPNPQIPADQLARQGPLQESFENLDGPHQARGWILEDDQRTEITAENGNHFLCLRNDKKPNYTAAILRVRLQPTWKRLRLAARLRAVNLVGGVESDETARLGCLFEDAAHNRVGDWAWGLETLRDADWQEEVTELNIPKGAEFIQLAPQMLNTVGEADFDDIKVWPIPALEPLPVRAGMPEGTFEQRDENGSPLGWRLIDPQAITVGEENGNHFLRLSNAAHPALHAEAAFKLNPAWKKITLRLRMRASNMQSTPMGSGRAALSYDFANQDEGYYAPLPSALTVKSDTD
ncbi:MAG: hypothetical protein JOZ57_11115, partial [Abitibacteriaceae bacterium]|nr:hypothetical protein [Abditibacteriaceae bacterium]